MTAEIPSFPGRYSTAKIPLCLYLPRRHLSPSIFGHLIPEALCLETHKHCDIVVEDVLPNLLDSVKKR